MTKEMSTIDAVHTATSAVQPLRLKLTPGFFGPLLLISALVTMGDLFWSLEFASTASSTTAVNQKDFMGQLIAAASMGIGGAFLIFVQVVQWMKVLIGRLNAQNQRIAALEAAGAVSPSTSEKPDPSA